MTRLSPAEIQDLYVNADHQIGLNTTWRHKKGGVYIVRGFDLDTDSPELRVRYERIAGPNYSEAAEEGITYSRPIFEWASPRFERITN